jgi:hypothetical protein
MRFQMLIPRCQGLPTQLNVNRQRVPAASRWNPRWPPETGSSNNFACITDRNAISNAKTMFSRVADNTDRRSTQHTDCVQVNSKMNAQKSEVAIILLVPWVGGRSQRLMPCFQGSPTQWNVDRY